MAKITPQDKLAALQQEMSYKAAREAELAWKEHSSTGYLANYKLPLDNIGMMAAVRDGFRIGYGMCLLDRIYQSVKEMEKLAQQNLADNANYEDKQSIEEQVTSKLLGKKVQ